MKPGQASSTACLIAESLVFLSHDPVLGRLVPPKMAETSRRMADVLPPPHSIRLRWTANPLFQILVKTVERLTVPGMLLHYLLRKRYLEQVTRKSLQDGIRQVVILGAGFDTLPLRLLDEFPEVRWIELDHPDTQAFKRRALEKCTPSRSNHVLVPLDFMHLSPKDVLKELPFYQKEDRTLFLAEGLLMYFPPERVLNVFRMIRSMSVPQSRLAFTCMEPGPGGRIEFKNQSRWVGSWLNRRGEIFRWAVDRHRMPDFLSAEGFSWMETAAADTFRSLYLVPDHLERLPLAEGEYVCLAERP